MDIPAVIQMQIIDFFSPKYGKDNVLIYFSLLYTIYSLPNVILPLFGGVLSDKIGIFLFNFQKFECSSCFLRVSKNDCCLCPLYYSRPTHHYSRGEDIEPRIDGLWPIHLRDRRRISKHLHQHSHRQLVLREWTLLRSSKPLNIQMYALSLNDKVS